MKNWYKLGVFLRTTPAQIEYSKRCTEYANVYSFYRHEIYNDLGYISLAVL